MKWTIRPEANLKFIATASSTNFTSIRTRNCTPASKDNLYILLESGRRRTGNQLFQIFCLLALASKFCYTAIVEMQNEDFSRIILQYFDLRHVQIQKHVNKRTFYDITDVLSEDQLKNVSQHRHNWTLEDKCFGYELFEGQENFIRSSVHLRKNVTNKIDKYVKNTFGSRSTVAIHVRRTDRVNSRFCQVRYQYRGLDWYKPYIDRAMTYLKGKYSDLVFIFVSDDIEWCKENFHGEDIYFSPFSTQGHDLALIARCEHMIFTVGTYGWNGAWLGEKKTVIYSKDYLPLRYTEPAFLYPWWTGI